MRYKIGVRGDSSLYREAFFFEQEMTLLAGNAMRYRVNMKIRRRNLPMVLKLNRLMRATHAL